MSFRYFVMVGAAALALGACTKNDSSSDANHRPAAEHSETAAAAKEKDGPRKVTPPAQSAQDKKEDAKEATTVLESLGDSGVKGTVTFTEKVSDKDGNQEKHIVVTYNITGLTPGETRGFHIHEHGDCSSEDGMSAGGHFNPHGHDHGDLDGDEVHAGDLGNITADKDGNARGKIKNVTQISLNKKDDTYIVGRSVIVHEKEDDLKSQPTGDAGGRVACGVIELKPSRD